MFYTLKGSNVLYIMLLNIFFNFSSISRNCISVNMYLHEFSLASNIYERFLDHFAPLQKPQFTVKYKPNQHAVQGSGHYQFPEPLCAQQYQHGFYCRL